MSTQRSDSSKGPIRLGHNQQNPNDIQKPIGQNEERAWKEKQQNNPQKQQREREWEDAQRKQQSEDLETEE